MTDREKSILQDIDYLTENCIEYLESNYLPIPNIGLFNIDLVVLSFLIDHLLEKKGFRGQRLKKFLDFYENHFISNRCKSPRKKTIYSLDNDEFDSKNLVAYINFEEMSPSEKKQYFIRTLSNISSDIDKFIESARNYSDNESSKVHYPYLVLISVYVNPLFCYKIPKSDYNQEINYYLSYEFNNSKIDLVKFLTSFSKMWFDVISKYFKDDTMLLDFIELNFPNK